jgi:hypothetical protein
VQQLLAFRYKRAITTSRDAIMSTKHIGQEHFMTAEFMRSELEENRARLPDLPTPLPKAKGELASLLVAARKKYAAQLPDFATIVSSTPGLLNSTIASTGAPGLVVVRGEQTLEPLKARLFTLPDLIGLPLASRAPASPPAASGQPAHQRPPAASATAGLAPAAPVSVPARPEGAGRPAGGSVAASDGSAAGRLANAASLLRKL